MEYEVIMPERDSDGIFKILYADIVFEITDSPRLWDRFCSAVFG